MQKVFPCIDVYHNYQHNACQGCPHLNEVGALKETCLLYPKHSNDTSYVAPVQLSGRAPTADTIPATRPRVQEHAGYQRPAKPKARGQKRPYNRSLAALQKGRAS